MSLHLITVIVCVRCPHSVITSNYCHSVRPLLWLHAGKHFHMFPHVSMRKIRSKPNDKPRLSLSLGVVGLLLTPMLMLTLMLALTPNPNPNPSPNWVRASDLRPQHCALSSLYAQHKIRHVPVHKKRRRCEFWHSC